MISRCMQNSLKAWFEEDGLTNRWDYFLSLPQEKTQVAFMPKETMVFAGLPFAWEVFRYLKSDLELPDYKNWEGKEVKAGESINFELPFHVALTGERLALNLIQKTSSIATHTQKYVAKAKEAGVKILETRKTTPGLRDIEKYATKMGGAYNHRFSQTDIWMIKDNHKNFFGGLRAAWDHFQKLSGFYQGTIVEIHDLKEWEEALELGVKHFMLDNFSPENIKIALKNKREDTTVEVSGGIRLENLDAYLIPGVDALSIGHLTYGAPPLDISFNIHHA